jgi:tellurite resistance protein
VTDDKLRDALRSIHDKVSPAEASAIVDVARLAAGVDGHTHPDELATIKQLSKIVYELANVADVPAPTQAIDPGRLLDIGDTLERMGPRELAFAGAIAVATHGEITSEEQAFISQLAEALLLEQPRARELTLTISALVASS